MSNDIPEAHDPRAELRVRVRVRAGLLASVRALVTDRDLDLRATLEGVLTEIHNAIVFNLDSVVEIRYRKKRQRANAIIELIANHGWNVMVWQKPGYVEMSAQPMSGGMEKIARCSTDEPEPKYRCAFALAKMCGVNITDRSDPAPDSESSRA